MGNTSEQKTTSAAFLVSIKNLPVRPLVKWRSGRGLAPRNPYFLVTRPYPDTESTFKTFRVRPSQPSRLVCCHHGQRAVTSRTLEHLVRKPLVPFHGTVKPH